MFCVESAWWLCYPWEHLNVVVGISDISHTTWWYNRSIVFWVFYCKTGFWHLNLGQMSVFFHFTLFLKEFSSTFFPFFFIFYFFPLFFVVIFLWGRGGGVNFFFPFLRVLDLCLHIYLKNSAEPFQTWNMLI